MTVTTILVILLILILVGGFYGYQRSPTRQYGDWPGLVVAVLVVLLVLVLLGVIHI